MQIFFVILTLILFLFSIYKLVKDDHVFFRRNIRLEHFFDFTFITLLIIIFIFEIFNVQTQDYVIYGIIIAAAVLYLISKYKKIQTGRFFDFFSLSFMIAYPFWLFLQSLITANIERVINIANFIFYLILAIYFLKKLLPKIMNRSLREGSLSIFFIVFYSFLTLLVSSYNIIYNKSELISIHNILAFLMLIGCVPLLIKIQK